MTFQQNESDCDVKVAIGNDTRRDKDDKQCLRNQNRVPGACGDGGTGQYFYLDPVPVCPSVSQCVQACAFLRRTKMRAKALPRPCQIVRNANKHIIGLPGSARGGLGESDTDMSSAKWAQLPG
jgi:hypothetical protein